MTDLALNSRIVLRRSDYEGAQVPQYHDIYLMFMKHPQVFELGSSMGTCQPRLLAAVRSIMGKPINLMPTFRTSVRHSFRELLNDYVQS